MTLPEPIRLAVIGCGRVFERFHLPALAGVPDLKVVAVCEADADRLDWARARLPGIAHAASLEALPATARPAAVLLLTPPATHRALAERGLSIGLHVLVEKPMTLDLTSAQAMARAARQAGRRLQVGYTRRFRAPCQALRHELRSRAGGAIRAISYELAVPSAAWGAKAGFLGVDAEGGGVLDDVLSHQIDLIRWIGGAEVRRVRATALAGEAVECELELASGVKAQCRAAHAAYAEYLEVVLNEGGALAASGAHLYRTMRPAGGLRRGYARAADRAMLALNRATGRRGLTLQSFEAQLRDFASAIRGAPSHGAGPDDGIAAVAAVQAARASLADGGWREIG